MAQKAMAAADIDKDGKISIAECESYRWLLGTEFANSGLSFVVIKWGTTCYELNKVMDQMGSYDLRPPGSSGHGFVLSGPTNFRKIGHVGFNPETGGFVAQNLPPEWKELFKQAGVTEQEAADPETARYILKVIAQNTQPGPPSNRLV